MDFGRVLFLVAVASTVFASLIEAWIVFWAEHFDRKALGVTLIRNRSRLPRRLSPCLGASVDDDQREIAATVRTTPHRTGVLPLTVISFAARSQGVRPGPRQILRAFERPLSWPRFVRPPASRYRGSAVSITSLCCSVEAPRRCTRPHPAVLLHRGSCWSRINVDPDLYVCRRRLFSAR